MCEDSGAHTHLVTWTSFRQDFSFAVAAPTFLESPNLVLFRGYVKFPVAASPIAPRTIFLGRLGHLVCLIGIGIDSLQVRDAATRLLEAQTIRRNGYIASMDSRLGRRVPHHILGSSIRFTVFAVNLART